MADDNAFMTGLNTLGTLIGIGSSLKDIFGAGPPSAADIAAAISAQVEQAFFRQQADAQIITASGYLAAAQQFLAVDYVNAAGESRAEKWALLDASSTAPGLSQLTAAAAALDAWIGEADAANQDLVVCKAATAYIGIYLTICLFHRERAAVAPDDVTKAAELKDIGDKARLALGNIMPRVMGLCDKRLAALDYTEYQRWRVVVRRTYYYNIAQITDGTFSGGGADTIYAWQPADEDNDFSKVMHRVWNAYHRVLFSGSDADCNEFRSSLSNARMAGLDDLISGASRDDFVANSYPSVCAFGKWAQNTRNLLGQLDVLASGVTSGEQDGWAWCSRCVGLFFSGTPSVCPANGGPHWHDMVSKNYVLNYKCTPVPGNMQDNWKWCKKCSILYLDQGARVCPAGGSHDASGSANYAIAYGAVPDGSVRGFGVTDSNWRWCSKCAALHYGAGDNTCPAGGQHDNSGSANYWLSEIGSIPQP